LLSKHQRFRRDVHGSKCNERDIERDCEAEWGAQAKPSQVREILQDSDAGAQLGEKLLKRHRHQHDVQN
jgi:hypothetical protein